MHRIRALIEGSPWRLAIIALTITAAVLLGRPVADFAYRAWASHCAATWRDRLDAQPIDADLLPWAIVFATSASRIRRDYRRGLGRCGRCGYPRGAGARCTECGAPFPEE